MRHLEKGRIVIFAAGTGNPYFTTDTAAALRAAEIDAEVILKATQASTASTTRIPSKNPTPQRYERVSYDEALQRNLRVMDQTAIALCRENGLPIVVFDMSVPGNLAQGRVGRGGGHARRRVERRRSDGRRRRSDWCSTRRSEAMEKSLAAACAQDLQKVRTGRASPALLDGIHGRLLRHADAAEPARAT